MATLNATHQDIYKDVRGFLLGLFPGSELQIIQSAQNNQPLPKNAVVMQVLFVANLDTAVVTPTPATQSADIQNSVEVRFQIDFYGPLAEQRSRIVANLWRTYYGCERLTVCQPLYIQSYNRHVYVNDSNQYEDRWIMDLGLQYNPQVTVAQDFTDLAPVVDIIPVTE